MTTFFTPGDNRRFSKLIFRMLSMGILLLLVVLTSNAQGTKTLEIVQNLRTPSSTNKITVYYSEGYKKKALELRSLIEEAMRFYERKLGIKEEFSLAVLTQDQWSQVRKSPYGLPWVSGRPHVAFLPATEDGVVAADALSFKETVSPATLKKIKASGYSFEKGAQKFVDLIGLHELGHVYASTYGIRAPNKWLNEMLASYFAYAFLREKHPKLAMLFYAMAAELVPDNPKQKYTSLEDFDRLYSGVGVKNYDWYQGKFFQRVAQVYEVKGLSFLTDVRDAFPQEKQESLTPEAVLHRLERISTGFLEWSKDLR